LRVSPFCSFCTFLTIAFAQSISGFVPPILFAEPFEIAVDSNVERLTGRETQALILLPSVLLNPLNVPLLPFNLAAIDERSTEGSLMREPCFIIPYALFFSLTVFPRMPPLTALGGSPLSSRYHSIAMTTGLASRSSFLSRSPPSTLPFLLHEAPQARLS